MSLKPLLFSFFLFLWFDVSNAQTPVVEWQHCYGGNNLDQAACIQLTPDGGSIIIGYTASQEGDVKGYHGTGNGGDAWVIKLDKEGNNQWQKCLGGTDSEQGAYILPTDDGGYILTATLASRNCILPNTHGAYDYWVVKLDGSGNMMWQKCYGGSQSDIPVAIAAAKGGGYFVTGMTLSNDGDITGNQGMTDCWTIKIDVSGNLLWQKCTGGTDYDNATGLQPTADGGCVVVGLPGKDIPGSHGSGDYWITKFDAAGNIQWQKCYGGVFSDFSYAVQLTNDGGYIIGGTSNSFDGDVSGNHGIGFDACVIKIDQSGNIQWQKCYGGALNETIYSIQSMPDGGYIMAGTAYSTDGDLTCNAGRSDAWVFKIKSNGDLEWQKTIGGKDDDAAVSIQPLADGSFIMAGWVGSADIAGYHPTTATYPVGNNDFWIVKLSAPVASAPAPVVTIDASYAKVCAGRLSAIKATVLYGGLNPVYNWTKNGLPAGTNSATYAATDFADNDVVQCTVTNGGPVCGQSLLQGSGTATLIINSSVINPSISISSDKMYVCDCVPVTFNATVVNGGTAPVYEWQVNGLNMGITTPVFTSSELKTGDVITCSYKDTASCMMNGPLLSNAVNLQTYNGEAPAVSIAASSATVCAGTAATFTASATNAGANPVYQWQVNGQNVGANSNSFTGLSFSTGDRVTCSITIDPKYTCGNTFNANSNAIVIAVSAKLTPAVSIETTVGTVCKGSTATFTATASNAGTDIKYQWNVNDINTGTNAAVFSTATLNNGDIVTCTITADPLFNCTTAATATASPVTVAVNDAVPPSIIISTDNNNVCAGTNIIFKADAKNTGQQASFQWLLNNVKVGNNSPAFSSSSLINGESLYCMITPGIGACSSSPVASNTIVAIVNPFPVITSFSPKDTTIKPGNQVQFIVTGSSNITSYTWLPAGKLNSASISNPISVPLFQNTNFTLDIVSDKGCRSSAASSVRVGIPLIMPSAFTPNDDGVNDVFRIPFGVLLQLSEFSIFDRWGNVVFKTADINKGWNGTLNGKQQNGGSFVYVISGTSSKGKVLKKGTVLLVR